MNDRLAELVVCPRCATINRIPRSRIGAHPRPLCGECGAAMFEGKPVLIDTASKFDRHVLRGSLPVAVDFWADWCAPCRAIGPHFSEVARRLEPRLRFLKVDTEALPALAGRLAIRSLPTIVLFDGGRELSRRVGLVSATALHDWLVDHLGKEQRFAS